MGVFATNAEGLRVSNAGEQLDILLVEDNPNDAELAIRAMQMSGHTPVLVHVDDGVRAQT